MYSTRKSQYYRTIIWIEKQKQFTNIRLRFELFLPTKRFLLRYSNRWQKRSEKGNFSFQQAEVTGRAISFLASTLVENEREEERERGKRRGRGTENREKFRGQLFERAGEKLNGSRTLEINTFSRQPLFSRVLEKLQVSRRLWKKKEKKEYTNGKNIFVFFSLVEELNLCRDARNFYLNFYGLLFSTWMWKEKKL